LIVSAGGEQVGGMLLEVRKAAAFERDASLTKENLLHPGG
jgi:hypothetical protein